MALDTKEKRANVIGVGRPWLRDKFPVATPDEQWRIASGLAYGGNALSPAVVTAGGARMYYLTPTKNVAYTFYVSLVNAADAGAFKSNPTITAGDVTVSTDGSAFANVETLPTVDPTGSIGVKISLSKAEMNGDKIMVKCVDAGGNEWDDLLIFLDTQQSQIVRPLFSEHDRVTRDSFAVT